MKKYTLSFFNKEEKEITDDVEIKNTVITQNVSDKIIHTSFLYRNEGNIKAIGFSEGEAIKLYDDYSVKIAQVFN